MEKSKPRARQDTLHKLALDEKALRISWGCCALSLGMSVFAICARSSEHAGLAGFGMPGGAMSLPAALGIAWTSALGIPALTGSSSRPGRAIAILLAAGTTVIGLVTLVSARAAAGEPFFTGLTAESSLSLILIGSGSLLSAAGRSRIGHVWLDQLSAAIVLILSVITLTGFIFSAPGPHGMTLGTAIGFYLLATGLLLSNPDRGVMSLLTSHRMGGYMARRQVTAVLLAPLSSACSSASESKSASSARRSARR